MSRSYRYVRETKETRVELFLDIDSRGDVSVSTPIPFLNHMLETLFTYMNSTAMLNAIDKKGFDDHHVTEDVAIAIGEAFDRCLGDRVGIRRYGFVVIPMDDALVLISIDISGRGGAYLDLELGREVVGGVAVENVYHFIETFAVRSRTTVHVKQLSGRNTHHIIEAVFKGLGMALYEASRIVDVGVVRSTKGVI